MLLFQYILVELSLDEAVEYYLVSVDNMQLKVNHDTALQLMKKLPIKVTFRPNDENDFIPANYL